MVLKINKKALEFNIKKAKKLRKEGFKVGTVPFPSKKAALKTLGESKITKKRKQRLSLRKFKNIKTGKPIVIFIERRKK